MKTADIGISLFPDAYVPAADICNVSVGLTDILTGLVLQIL